MIAGALVQGFSVGDFWGEGSVLTGMPWGIVSLLDVYVGFALFCGWVVFREQSLLRAVIWAVLVLTPGNLVASGYVLLARPPSRGNCQTFSNELHSARYGVKPRVVAGRRRRY